MSSSADAIYRGTVFASLPTANTTQAGPAAVTFGARRPAGDTGRMTSLPPLVSVSLTVCLSHCAARRRRWSRSVHLAMAREQVAPAKRNVAGRTSKLLAFAMVLEVAVERCLL